MSVIVNPLLGLFSDVISEQGKGLIVSTIKNIKSNRDWKKLFVNSGKKFIESEETATLFMPRDFYFYCRIVFIFLSLIHESIKWIGFFLL